MKLSMHKDVISTSGVLNPAYIGIFPPVKVLEVSCHSTCLRILQFLLLLSRIFLRGLSIVGLLASTTIYYEPLAVFPSGTTLLGKISSH